VTEIVSQRQIALDPQVVYSAAKRVERFPDVLTTLDSVKVLEDDGAGHTVSHWAGTIHVGPLVRKVTWTERDEWDDSARCCTFKLLHGDMKEYSGEWTFTAMDGGCAVKLRVDFEMGIPMLGPLINRMVDQVMQQTCDELLEALEKLATV
jgi:coenzyme Q-binding protein COQ10